MNSQARFDYLRLFISHDHDIAQQAYGYLRKLLDEVKTWPNVNGNYSFRPQYNNATQQREYFVDVWGSLAQGIIELAPDYVAAFGLRRVDVRMPLPEATEKGIAGVARVLAGRGKGRRNVNVFNSAPRSKEGGRNAGGMGIAIGSHKSDWRGSIYKRGSEPAAMEGQYQGKKLRDYCGNLLRFADDPASLRQQFMDLVDELAHDTEMKLMDHLGVEPHDLERVLCGQASPLVLADDGDRYEQCEMLFRGLPPSQQRRLFDGWEAGRAA